jgi:O-antigen ligase
VKGRWLENRLSSWRETPLDPVVLVLCLGLLAAAAVSLHLAGVSAPRAQQLTAFAVLGFFTLAVCLSPRNGLALLLLVPPLFNGEDAQPYFWLLEALVYLTLGAGALAAVRRRAPLAFPHAWVFVLFLVSTVASFPLNLKEVWLELQVLSWPEVVQEIRRADFWASLFYARTVLNALSGVALYVLAANAGIGRDLVVRLAIGATLLQAAVCLVGLAWLRVFPPRLFLSLHLHGNMWEAFSGVGFNPSYFAQYAIAYLPWAALVLAEEAPRWAKGLAAGTALLASYAVLRTYQRGAYLVWAVELALLGLVVMRWAPRGAPRRGRLVTAAGALAVALPGIFLLLPVGLPAIERFRLLWQTGDSYRQHALEVAWRMYVDQPILGIGSGRFAHMFQFYSSAEPWRFQWGWLSSHNLYAQFLAEQGALGLLAFLGILAATLGAVIRARDQAGQNRLAIDFVLVGLGAWLVYGLLQYTFLMRSMQAYFWLALGLLVSLSPRGRVPPATLCRPLALGLAVLLAVAVGARARTAAARPVQPGYEFGLHALEPPGVRWTRGGALMDLLVQGRTLRVTVACPIPQIAGRPQRVTVLLDGVTVSEVTLADAGWRTVEVPVARPPGSHVVLGLRVGYTFVPAALGLNADARQLGVLVRAVGWGP